MGNSKNQGMNYYDENDDRPKLYAGVAAAAYAVAMMAMLFLVYIPIKVAPESEMIIVEIIDEPRPKPRPVVTSQAPRHQNLSTTRENTQQVPVSVSKHIPVELKNRNRTICRSSFPKSYTSGESDIRIVRADKIYHVIALRRIII